MLIISGLITWGILIANLAAFLTARKSEVSKDPAIDDMQKKISRLDELSRRELVALRGAVSSVIEDKIERKKNGEAGT